jgi:hypothetical protein
MSAGYPHSEDEITNPTTKHNKIHNTNETNNFLGAAPDSSYTITEDASRRGYNKHGADLAGHNCNLTMLGLDRCEKQCRKRR